MTLMFPHLFNVIHSHYLMAGSVRRQDYPHSEGWRETGRLAAKTKRSGRDERNELQQLQSPQCTEYIGCIIHWV